MALGCEVLHNIGAENREVNEIMRHTGMKQKAVQDSCQRIRAVVYVSCEVSMGLKKLMKKYVLRPPCVLRVDSLR